MRYPILFAVAALVSTPSAATQFVEGKVSVLPTARAMLDGIGEHGSLAAAVDALEDRRIDHNPELVCVAQAVYYESRGEGLRGQRAVADVIVNRTRRRGFPSSACGVVRQPNQFSNARSWRIPLEGDAAWRRAKVVAVLALSRMWTVSDTITHFHHRATSPGWRLRRLTQIGSHVFYGR